MAQQPKRLVTQALLIVDGRVTASLNTLLDGNFRLGLDTSGCGGEFRDKIYALQTSLEQVRRDMRALFDDLSDGNFRN